MLRRRDARDQQGQTLVLFVLLLTGMLMMSVLLFDAANALVIRRRIQNSADAAALAAANLIQVSPRGCNGGSGSTPRTLVANAATNSATANLSGLTVQSVTVTCLPGFGDVAVRVVIDATAPTFFGAIAGSTNVPVSAKGTAINGGVNGGKFSVVELNPYNSSWTKQGGCPSVLFSGGPTVEFDGSMQIDSACPAGSGGAMGTNGNSATLIFNNGAGAYMVGGFSPGPLVVTPTPKTGQPYLNDPLAALPPVPISSLPVRSNSKLVLSNTASVLEPGIYRGGIQLKNSSIAYLHPGLYVMDGGGLDIGAQASVYSLVSGATSATPLTWAANCPASSCGVLIYNTGTSSTLSQFTIGAGGTLLLRPYQPGYDSSGANVEEFRNLLVWQAASPVPSRTYTQPDVLLNGGGTVDISGSLYAPSARVYLTGGAGGAGGNTIDLTLQFISWDLQIQGNSHFHFLYNSDAFAKPFQYGLIQ